MNILQAGLLAALLAVGAATASAQPDLSGKWRVTFATEGSEGREGEVNIQGLAGTWVTHPRGNKDQKDTCVGRELPVTLAPGNASTVSLSLDAAKAVSGCRNRKARLTIVDDKTLEGEFDNGRVLKLVRQ